MYPIMTEAEKYILNYGKDRKQFSYSELKASTEEFGSSYINWTLVQLVEKGELVRVGHGIYAISDVEEFDYVPDEATIRLYDYLTKEFPRQSFCVYKGEILNPLLDTPGINALTYVETDRSRTEIVFRKLQADGEKVFHKPSRQVLKDYVNVSSPSVIVRPLITDSPLLYIDGIECPSIEKLLIDVRREHDFDYLGQSQKSAMLRTALQNFAVNRSTLLRYAGRRGIFEEIQRELESQDIRP